MGCQINNNEYFTPSGVESQLYKDLKSQVGKEAENLFIFAYSDTFNSVKARYRKSISSKLDSFKPNVSNLTYKIKKANGFETIQMYAGSKMLGYVRLKPFQDGNQIERVLLSNGVEKGQGLGTELYKRAIEYTIRDEKPLYSDASQTEDAKKVWDKLSTLDIVNQEGGMYKVEGLPQSHFDKNGEPKAVKVIEAARKINENKTPLTTVEKLEVGMFLAQFPDMGTSNELLVEMNKAFYKNGFFNPTVASLTKTLYSAYEAENLLSNLNTLYKVKDSIERLKNTEVIDNNTLVEATLKTDELDIFGKFKTVNPHILRQDTIEEFGGLESIDMASVRDKNITEEELKQFGRIPVIDENGEPIVNKVVYENATKVVANLETPTAEKLLNYGIDLSKVDEDIAARVLVSPTIPNVLSLNENAAQREKVVKTDKQDRNLVYLETLKTEEQLFNELDLLQTKTPNVYHKIEKVDEEELRKFLKASENISEIDLYKQYYKYTSPIVEPVVFEAAPIETDIDYLKEDFIADFNAEILKNPKHDFYNKFEVNEKGIILKYGDSISLSQIEAYIKDGVKYGKELADYSVINKNMPNLKEGGIVEDGRIAAINNKNKLKKPTTQVVKVDRNTLVVKNETAEFINYNNEVYELTNKENNDSVYTKLALKEDLNYFQTEVVTQEYTEQVRVAQPNLKNYNTIKRNYKKEDLGDNFDCLG